MLFDLWQTFLYEPVFNALIAIYNGWTNQNLGWAVVYLTIVLRLLLLPFTLLSERAEMQNEQIYKDVEQIDTQFVSDPVLKKEEIRKALKRRKIRPWSKAIVIGIQGLVLVLLYQVFLGGVTGEKVIHILYDFVDFPGRINTIFFGFDLGRRYDWFWAGICGVWLMVEVYVDLRKQKRALTKGDLLYFLLFPGAIFVALYILPMVKSLFILTSMLFSATVHQFVKPFFKKSTS